MARNPADTEVDSYTHDGARRVNIPTAENQSLVPDDDKAVKLLRYPRNPDLDHWVRFFLAGVLEISRKGRDTFQSVLALRHEMDALVVTLGKRAPNARAAMDLLYRKAIISAKDLEKELGVSTPTAQALVQDFVRIGILEEITGQPRYRLYVFDRYLKIFIS